MKMKKNTIKLTYSVLLLAVSLILGYIEAIFPINIGQFGVKIGLGNIVSILGLKTIGCKRTVIINALRLIILGILFGNLVRFILSVSGFVVSFIVMYILLEKINFGIIPSSIIAGIFHNLGQFIALIFIMKNINVIVLIPLYVITGLVSGFFVGVISSIIYNKIDFLKFEQ